MAYYLARSKIPSNDIFLKKYFLKVFSRAVTVWCKFDVSITQDGKDLENTLVFKIILKNGKMLSHTIIRTLDRKQTNFPADSSKGS